MKPRFNIWPLVITFFLVITFQNIVQQSVALNQVSYDEFIGLLESKQITEVVLGDTTIKGKTAPVEGKPPEVYVTNRVDEDAVKMLSPYNVKFRKEVENTFFRDILSWVIPPLIFVFIWIYFLKKMAQKGGGGPGGSLMSVGKSKAKVYVEKDTGKTFKDVAGVDEAKRELEEIVDFLKDKERYGRLGGRMPKGVLLVGPPGTGKTLLAKAVAGEAGVPFFSISGSEFVEMFVGVGAARVRDLFNQARKSSPCIIFIDELDALGKSRGANSMYGGNDEKEQTLNQLLTEMDGFETKEGIILLGATNRPEILDPALLRAGRFDRQVLVDRPDKTGRLEILKVHIQRVKYQKDLDLEQIASLTTGFTGADLENLVNEAALVATRKDKEFIELEDFTQATERIVAGLEKRNRILNDFERNVVAHHEMGHAIMGMALKSVDQVHKISIIPRGMGALGYTIQRPTEDRFLMKKEELEGKICVLLGGRVSEKIIFNHLSTGASDDLAKATDIARSMVTRYGMVKELGHVSLERTQQQFLAPDGVKSHDYSEATAKEIDDAVKLILENAYLRTLSILTNNKQLLIDSATELLKKETLEGEDLTRIKGSIIL
ncbi:MAG: ATP-dependent zinc metalloprotease FtsH [Bacteriovoracaceae bacterium]|nr:ATP-dependent zinc metalloprotease FtsH [Bacteriovoracaceae bacterium]